MKVLSKPIYTDRGITAGQRPADEACAQNYANQTAKFAQFFVTPRGNILENTLMTSKNVLLANGVRYSVHEDYVSKFIDKYGQLNIVYSDFVAYRDRRAMGIEHVRVSWVNEPDNPEVAKSLKDVTVVDVPHDSLRSDSSKNLTVSLYLPDFYAKLARERKMHSLSTPEAWEALEGPLFERTLRAVADLKVKCEDPLEERQQKGLETLAIALEASALGDEVRKSPRMRRQPSRLERMVAELKTKLPPRVRTISEQSTESNASTKSSKSTKSTKEDAANV